MTSILRPIYVLISFFSEIPKVCGFPSFFFPVSYLPQGHINGSNALGSASVGYTCEMCSVFSVQYIMPGSYMDPLNCVDCLSSCSTLEH